MDIPVFLEQPRLQPLFALQLRVDAPHDLGVTPQGDRRLAIISSGIFQGDRLRGEVVEGNDWLTIRTDGVWTMDVRALLRTDDGALVALHYSGCRHGTREVIDRLNRKEPVDPSEYYFRISARFETSAPHYEWLNKLLAIGIGHRCPEGPLYNLFELL